MTNSPDSTSLIRIWIGFIAMCLGMFMAILDIQIVVTSLPAISAALDIPADQMSWVQTAYLIAEVIAIPLTGFMTRALGLRGLFLIALSVFTLASFACAQAYDFQSLIIARTVQGFAGGSLIPLVFSAVFLMFPVRQQAAATTIAGALAVLAPTLGPTIGGYITQTYDWSWLFLVNIGPGILSLLIAALCIARQPADRSIFKQMDWLGVLFLALSLTALEIGLKEGPKQGWFTSIPLTLIAICLVAAILFIRQGLNRKPPLVHIRLFSEGSFALACALSFLFGIGLFASVYLMPVFLGLVRGMNPLEIGLIMLVTGVAQLITAPIAVQLELRVDARLLSALGFAGFAIGLGMSGFQTAETGFDEMFWPQIVRGVSIMFCLLPPTRLALGHLSEERVADGSGLFNLMRNLGGAIGIALVDTVLWQRTPHHGEALAKRVLAGDADAALQVGIPPAMVPPPGTPIDEATMAMVRPMFEKAGLVEAVNEAWLLISLLTVIGLLLIPLTARWTGSPK